MAKHHVEEDNPHKGHRERLRSLIDQVGFSNITPIQQIEQILTMTIPRGDTNVIAHRLLNKFGSISKILDADYEDLAKVEGAGERTAKMLTYLPLIFEVYTHDKVNNRFTCSKYTDILAYFKTIFGLQGTESIIIAFLDEHNKFDDFEVLARGDFANVAIDKSKLSRAMITKKNHSFIIAHNHPNGSCHPSTQDRLANDQLVTIVNTIGVRMIDDVIYGIDGLYSFKNNMVVTE